MKLVDPPSPDAGNARSHALPNAVWHASPHACFLSRLSLAHRVWQSRIPVNPAHTSTHVFIWSALASDVTRPEPGSGRLCSAAYLSREASSRVAVHGVDAVVPLREGRRLVSFFLVKRREKTWDARRTGATRAWGGHPRDARLAACARASDRARPWFSRRASRPRVWIVSVRACLPTALSRSRSCPRNTPSALRSGTLSWREIAASNARLRRRTRARGRGGSSTRRRRRTASSFDSCRTSGSRAGPKRGSLQGSSPCDRRSDDVTRQR